VESDLGDALHMKALAMPRLRRSGEAVDHFLSGHSKIPKKIAGDVSTASDQKH
jgi:hypothetical protein